MCLALFIVQRPAAPSCAPAAPGFVDSEHAMREFPEERRENYVHNVQLVKRLGRTEDVASAVRFLCSDEASFITAETLLVSGGALPRIWAGRYLSDDDVAGIASAASVVRRFVTPANGAEWTLQHAANARCFLIDAQGGQLVFDVFERDQHLFAVAEKK